MDGHSLQSMVKAGDLLHALLVVVYSNSPSLPYALSSTLQWQVGAHKALSLLTVQVIILSATAEPALMEAAKLVAATAAGAAAAGDGDSTGEPLVQLQRPSLFTYNKVRTALPESADAAAADSPDTRACYLCFSHKGTQTPPLRLSFC